MKKLLLDFIKSPKNWILIALVVILGLVGIFGGKAVSKYNEKIGALRFDKNRLERQIIDRENKIKIEQRKVVVKQSIIDSCMQEFVLKNRKIKELQGNLDDVLGQLEGITSDSSYIFLTQIAYNYPGILKYLFNELQVKAIHGDYLRARSAEKVIPALTAQMRNCTFQFLERDSLAQSLQKTVNLQTLNLTDCKQINKDNDKIIKDLEKTANKERRRKNFWRMVSALEPIGTVVILVAFGLL